MTTRSVAAPVHIACPVEVPASAVQVRVADGEWAAFIDSPARLVGANVSAGPPGSYATLVGEPGARSNATVQTVKYRFERESLRNENWIECVYGGRPEISLFKRLRDDVAECTIETRRREKYGPAEVIITCRTM
jgi:hypothetical protein